jgi:uncharacterized protein
MGAVYDGTLDTNVLLRFLLGDVPAQSEASKKIITGGGPWYVSLLSVAEIVFVLEGLGFTRPEIKQNIEVLAACRSLSMHRSVALPALELFVLRPALSFIDACLPHEATAEDAAPLLTFDKKLARQTSVGKLVQ